jgi:hypothetical protein
MTTTTQSPTTCGLCGAEAPITCGGCPEQEYDRWTLWHCYHCGRHFDPAELLGEIAEGQDFGLVDWAVAELEVECRALVAARG